MADGLLTPREVERLLRLPADDWEGVREPEDLQYCAATDAVLGVERIRKGASASECLQLLRRRQTTFHRMVGRGWLRVASLDAEALVRGLFTHGRDGECSVWLPAAGCNHPADSMRRAAIRAAVRTEGWPEELLRSVLEAGHES